MLELKPATASGTSLSIVPVRHIKAAKNRLGIDQKTAQSLLAEVAYGWLVDQAFMVLRIQHKSPRLISLREQLKAAGHIEAAQILILSAAKMLWG